LAYVIIGCTIIFLMGVYIGYCIPKRGCKHRWSAWSIIRASWENGKPYQVRTCLHIHCQKTQVIPVT
jgi:hypothetical protein